MKSSQMFRAAVGVCTAALMAGCTQQAGVPGAAPVVYRPAYVLSVHSQPGDTAASLAETYHGRVMEFDPSAGYALIGMDAATARQYSMDHSSAGVLSTPALAPSPEPNVGVFSDPGSKVQMEGSLSVWAGGSLSVWAGRSLSVWAGGSLSVWAGGTYAPVPGNTDAFTRINLQSAQALAPKLGAGVKVAVIDTGLDLSHPAFAGALAPASEWKDYVDGDAVPQDEGTLGTGGYGHGTAVASIILQVAPGATILPLRVLGADGSGDVNNVAAAIRYAAQDGAKVINLSLGSDVRSQIVQDAIVCATSAPYNAMVVMSAGNGNLSTLTYPALDASGKGPTPDHSLSVGSVDGLDQKASFSNYSTKLETVAPGVGIYAAAPGGMLVPWSGTSMSAPIAAGGLALAAGQLATLPPDLARKIAENASTSIYSSNLNSSYNGQLGRGRLDLSKFLSAVVPTPK